MTLTVGQRIEAQGSGLVGRESERAFLHSVLGEEGPFVVFIHGIGGVGKSTLVEAFTTEARARGAVVLGIDSGSIEPTPRGFLAAISNATGGDLTTADEAARRLASLGDRVVLVLDRYEVLRPIDLWLLQTFVPALDEGTRVVLSGREGPLQGWSTGMGRLFRSLPLGNLPREDAEALLRHEGVDGDDLERINRLARGHPLSLRLAAAALVAGPELDHEATTVTAIVEELTELYLARLEPLTRQALDAASVVRRPTLSLLAAMLPDAAPQDAFERLRGLPFVELSGDGLVLHDTVREVVAAYLRASDPDRSRRYRIAAWRLLRDEVTRATSHEMWRYTADLLFILESPGRARGLLPDVRAPLLRRACPARRLAGDPGDRRRGRAARVRCDLRGLVAPPAGRVLGSPRRRRASRRGRRCDPDRRDPADAVRCRSARPDLAGRRASIARAARSADSLHPRLHGPPGRPGLRPRGRGPDPQHETHLHGAAARVAPRVQHPSGAIRTRVPVDDAGVPEHPRYRP